MECEEPFFLFYLNLISRSDLENDSLAPEGVSRIFVGARRFEFLL